MPDPKAGIAWLRSRPRPAPGRPEPSCPVQLTPPSRIPSAHEHSPRRAPGVSGGGRHHLEGTGGVPSYVPEGAEFDYEQGVGYRADDPARMYAAGELAWYDRAIGPYQTHHQPSERDREAVLPAPEELEDWDLSPLGQPIRAREVSLHPVDPAHLAVHIDRSWRPTDEEWTPTPRPPIAHTGGLPYVASSIVTIQAERRDELGRGWLAEARLAYRDAETPQWAIDQAAELRTRRGLRCHVGYDDAVLAFGRPPAGPAAVPEAAEDPAPPRKEPDPARPGGPTPVEALDEEGAITPEAWEAYWRA